MTLAIRQLSRDEVNVFHPSVPGAQKRFWGKRVSDTDRLVTPRPPGPPKTGVVPSPVTLPVTFYSNYRPQRRCPTPDMARGVESRSTEGREVGPSRRGSGPEVVRVGRRPTACGDTGPGPPVLGTPPPSTSSVPGFLPGVSSWGPDRFS